MLVHLYVPTAEVSSSGLWPVLMFYENGKDSFIMDHMFVSTQDEKGGQQKRIPPPPSDVVALVCNCVNHNTLPRKRELVLLRSMKTVSNCIVVKVPGKNSSSFK